jgi:5S rRNA maturation endonuclease (ribonuclease M5)
MKRLTNNQIYQICDKLLDRLPELLRSLDIEYIEFPNRYSFACPIHSGDNPEGCCIFTDGISSKGNWQCWTQHCESEFTNSLFGFIRGTLSEKRNKKLSLNETADFCADFLNVDIDKIEEYSTSNHNSGNILDVFNKKIDIKFHDISRDEIRSKINIPAEYYVERGFKQETLDLFDIGFCFGENRPMSGRVVVPIYDEGYNYVGCVGRSISETIKPKWLHSKGFKKSILYGLNIAKKYIHQSQAIILVEGQGDVWRMHEAGYKNCVGIFGSSINEDQLLLLEQSGALNVIILTDSDEAGQKACDQIIKKCGRRFNYFRPEISLKDVGEMTAEQIQAELNPQLKGICRYEK